MSSHVAKIAKPESGLFDYAIGILEQLQHQRIECTDLLTNANTDVRTCLYYQAVTMPVNGALDKCADEIVLNGAIVPAACDFFDGHALHMMTQSGICLTTTPVRGRSLNNEWRLSASQSGYLEIFSAERLISELRRTKHVLLDGALGKEWRPLDRDALQAHMQATQQEVLWNDAVYYKLIQRPDALQLQSICEALQAHHQIPIVRRTLDDNVLFIALLEKDLLTLQSKENTLEAGRRASKDSALRM
jgi:hypothetical protein